MKSRKFTNLFKKLKKTNIILRIIYILTVIIYLASIILLTKELYLLEGIETLIRVFVIITLYLYFIFYLIGQLIFLLTKRNKTFIFLFILTTLFSAVNLFGYYYINKTYNVIEEINKEKIIYTTNFIKLKDFKGEIKTIGLISNKDDLEGYILPQEYIINHDLKYKIKNYETDIELLNALYDKKIDAIFIGSNYAIKYGEEERFTDIKEKTTVIDSYSKKLDNQDTVASTGKEITEPFTVLLLGVDSEYDGLSNNSAFNGDSIMMLTFNPKTLSATAFSIPRDTYVPIACNHNKPFKINSAAGYGTKCMIDTVQNLVGIDIDYYVKINFKGVVSLVEALGGITIDTEKPDFNKNAGWDCEGQICEQNSNREFGSNLVYVPVGENVTLNGEQALAYARNRHQWAMSDFKRIEHQQAVVTAIANKAKNIREINKFYAVLNAIANNIDTNMPTKQILNFYNVGKNILLNNNMGEKDFINIQRTFLAGYDLSVYVGYNAYTYQYYEESLNEIVKAMKENLEITKPEMIKEFDFSVNTEYKVPVIGKNFTSAKRNETLPDFKDKTIQYTEEWLSSRGITLNKNYTESNSCINDTIRSQSIHSGIIVSTISSLDVDICKNIHIEDIKPNENNEEQEENKEQTTNNNEDNKQNENTNTNDENKPEIDVPIENMITN